MEGTFGRGLMEITSSFSLGLRSVSVRMSVRRESVSRVSRRRSRLSGRPDRLGRVRLREFGVSDGSPAFWMAGEVVMGSSSGLGEGEAFRFFELDVLDTVVAIALSADVSSCNLPTPLTRDSVLDLDGERRECSWK